MKIIHHLDIPADGFGEFILFFYSSKNTPDPLSVRGVNDRAFCDQGQDEGVHCFDFSPERKAFSEAELGKRSRAEDPFLVDKVSVMIETNPLIPPRAYRKPAVEAIANLRIKVDQNRTFLLDLQICLWHKALDERFSVHCVSGMFWDVVDAAQAGIFLLVFADLGHGILQLLFFPHKMIDG